MTTAPILAPEGIRLDQCVRSVRLTGIWELTKGKEPSHQGASHGGGPAKGVSGQEILAWVRYGRQHNPQRGSLGKDRLMVLVSMKRKIRAWLSNLLANKGDGRPGFFTRYDYAAAVPTGVPTYPEMEALLSRQEAKFLNMIEDFSSNTSALKRAVEEGHIPWEEKAMFPPVDVAAAYNIIRTAKPSRVIEIGSGASTQVIHEAIQQNGEGKLTCIDPSPRRSISHLGIDWKKRPLSREDVELCKRLETNDVLFIDSSHIMLQGLDVDIQFNRIFPILAPGVLVHVHDIFLPDGYPTDWSQRYYSEQCALFGWVYSGFFEVLFPSYFMATRHPNSVETLLCTALQSEPRENAGSIWLRRTVNAELSQIGL